MTSNSYEVAQKCLPALRPEGQIVIAGVSNTSFTIDPILTLLGNRQRIVGTLHHGNDVIHQALQMVADRKVKPMIETYDIGDASTRTSQSSCTAASPPA